MSTAAAAMYEVKLPDIGEGVAEGEIVRWLVAAGDAVKEDQPLVEVMTDKASVEIPSPRTGTIASIDAEVGAVVPVGSVLLKIAVAGGGAATPATPSHAGPAPPPAKPTAPASSTPASGARVEATPAVRALAKELGVALENVRGTGPGGRLTADDVRAAASGASAAAPKPAGGGAKPAAKPAEAGTTRIPLRGLRRKIAEQMKKSVTTAAQFTFVAECDFTALVEHKESVKARAEKAGVKLTYLAYVLRALPAVLRDFPLLNSSLDDEAHEIIVRQAIHLAFAAQTDEGLTAPVIHDADRRGLFALAREIDRLAQAARAQKLKLDEVQGGTFTVTTTGARGGVLATPILHHPQVAILGLHAVTKKPAVVNGQIVARDLGNFSLTLDHRVVDGAVGADFLYALIERLQSPAAWLTEEDFA